MCGSEEIRLVEFTLMQRTQDRRLMVSKVNGSGEEDKASILNGKLLGHSEEPHQLERHKCRQQVVVPNPWFSYLV